jgi:hypothetical protein
LPRAVWRARDFSEPPSAASARFVLSVSQSAAIAALLALNSAEWASSFELILVKNCSLPGNVPRRPSERNRPGDRLHHRLLGGDAGPASLNRRRTPSDRGSPRAPRR